MSKQTNTLSPSPKGFQSPKFSDSDFREVRELGLGRPKSSAIILYYILPLVFIIWSLVLVSKLVTTIECSSHCRVRLPARLPGALVIQIRSKLVEIQNISECIARVIQIWSKLVETRNISECMEKLDNNVVFAEQGCYAMLNAWRNWTIMQYFEQCM
jgi:hypothetical protein